MFLAFQWAITSGRLRQRLFGFEDIGAPHHFVEGAEAEGCHDFP
jgi:hypothetical protein